MPVYLGYVLVGSLGAWLGIKVTGGVSRLLSAGAVVLVLYLLWKKGVFK
ncbi:hypothetical protein HGP28_10695 [Vibrio sp. SM6]|uniref:Uncharacterized protein n=1 Tax=Vibrio agarilyticus TaxID=2726741 RepID=A0A7X8YH98_9VIBR|nr:hypothetical protein [Vibrio agarilyticus]NLS13360.1 hypothetical protein [Vibrio agarilyticus]